MHFSQSNSDFFIPDGSVPEAAFARTSALGIGAHQDDLEFMAMHPILNCYESEEKWFGGIICTDGAGSARAGKYAQYTDEQMKAIRAQEQRTAATLGRYSFILQAAHPSAHAKERANREALAQDIRTIIEASEPETIYTHNPFDKHLTHLGVLAATVEAIHALPLEKRPKALLGCEVWRGLDWLPDSLKIAQDVSALPELSQQLNATFDSQIAGGKRYDLAVAGRQLANATFLDSHTVDDASRISYAIDMSALITGEHTLESFIDKQLEAFSQQVKESFKRVQ